MTSYLPAIFSFLAAAAGWFYFLHAERAKNLLDFETAPDNLLRIRLRRFGGVIMILLAICFFGAYSFSNKLLVLICLMLVLLFLCAILFLGWVDMRLTHKMRETLKRKSKS